jgi:hypothetical protein
MRVLLRLAALAAIVLLFTISFVSAQKAGDAPAAPPTKEQALKELRKQLERNSRYQVQEIIINFRAMDFKTCNISYTFERPDATGGDNFGRAQIDPASPSSVAVNQGSRGSQTTSSVTGNSAGVMSNNDPTFANRESTFFNTQRTTTMNLADIDTSSLQVVKNNKGTFLTLKTLDGKRTIVRTARGNGATPGESSAEVFPLSSDKKVDVVKQAIVQAVTACQAAN